MIFFLSFLKLKFKRLILTKFFVISVFVLFAQDKTFTTKLPIVYLNTGGKTIIDDPRIIIQMEIAWKGEGETNSTSDPRTHFNGKINIEIPLDILQKSTSYYNRCRHSLIQGSINEN